VSQMESHDFSICREDRLNASIESSKTHRLHE
jgi:hypothetical protein